MKKFIVLLLMLLLLAPAASATDTKYEFQSSDWARKDVKKAISLGLDFDSDGRDYRKPIKRGAFAENASSLVALKSGTTLNKYINIVNYREQVAGSEPSYPSPLEIANELDILQGRGNGNLDADSFITRQEATTMLARTYRAYGGETPDTLKPLSFADMDNIADWAKDDVQLMNHLNIMTGIGDDRFDPLGNYSIEQCFVTLLRLYQQTPTSNHNQQNLFAMTQREEAVADILINGSGFLFGLEAKDYYILAWKSGGLGGMQSPNYHISIIDQNLSHRTYSPTVLHASSEMRGPYEAMPENPSVSEDGTKLFYTVTLEWDVHHNYNSGADPKLLFEKGIYHVSMDLKTGEQTYTRTDLK